VKGIYSHFSKVESKNIPGVALRLEQSFILEGIAPIGEVSELVCI
jgi:hypothetical protein